MVAVGLTISERFTRAKFQLRKKYPFFAHLCFYLELHEVAKDSPELGYGMGLMSVDIKGNMYYCPETAMEFTDLELMAYLCHEVLHLALGHIIRTCGRDRIVWNWAIDIKSNDILVTEKVMQANDKKVLAPDDKHHIKFNKADIYDIDKKSAEEIYAELLEAQQEGKLPQTQMVIGFHLFDQDGDGDAGEDGKGESQGGGKDPSPMGGQSKAEIRAKIAQEWMKRMVDAKVQTELAKGSVPGCIDELLKNMLDPQIDWRVFVEQFVERSVISDFSYKRPRKSYYDNDIYLPSVVRESLALVYHVDSSGSMNMTQLAKAVGGLYSLLHAHPNVTAHVLVGDTELCLEVKLTTDESDDILELVKMKGRGGTSHRWVVDWINANAPEIKVFVSFTDGCSDIEDCYDDLPSGCEKLIVLTDGLRPDLKKYAEIINISDERDE